MGAFARTPEEMLAREARTEHTLRAGEPTGRRRAKSNAFRGTDLTEKAVREARNRFYPGWWTYEPEASEDVQPTYRVICRSLQDLNLARASRPPFVRARFVRQFAAPRGGTAQ